MSKSKILQHTSQQIQKYVEESNYYFQVLNKLGYTQINDQRVIKTLKEYCQNHDINISHLSADPVENGMKKCTRCLQTKSLTEFYVSKGKVMSYCKQCHKDLEKRRYKEKMDKLNEYKKTLVCKKCGEKRFYLFDFHHRDPSQKDYTISQNPHASFEVIKKEIDKCDVLCANCHREWHYLEQHNNISYNDWLQI